MIPDGFVFSQSSLQDYVDCPRRFRLRYLDHCRWPAPETADALEFEQVLKQGHAFHRLMRQLHSGVAASALEPAANAEPQLSRWWANYRASPPPDLPAALREAEVTLSIPFGAYRLEGRYDLLAAEAATASRACGEAATASRAVGEAATASRASGETEARWVIVDWKTGAKRISRAWLQNRLQTRIYPFVLVRGGASFNQGVPIPAGIVEMVYWFAEFPLQPERFIYSAEACDADDRLLTGLLHEIEERSSGDLVKTDNLALCRYCVYRSLCWDDVPAGRLADAEDSAAEDTGVEDLDLDAIAPIPF